MIFATYLKGKQKTCDLKHVENMKLSSEMHVPMRVVERVI